MSPFPGVLSEPTPLSAVPTAPTVQLLGRVDYAHTLAAMQAHAATRQPTDADAFWLCEHDPVYTLGLAGRAEHIHDAGDIPLVQSDRGGQVTYHGPGQLVAYPLVDLRRLGLGVKDYVYRLEHCVLQILESVGVTGHRVRGAPGVYVRLDDPFGHAVLDRRLAPAVPGAPRADQRAAFDGLAKIAALGVKVGRRCAYHGVALNVAMDLRPFDRIDPCGYAGLRTVDLATLGVDCPVDSAARQMAGLLVSHLSR